MTSRSVWRQRPWHHRSAEKEEKEEQRLFQAAASRPEGPAAPSVLRAVSQIICPSIFSNTMKCGSLRGVSGSVMAEDTRGCLGGCFFIRASRTSLVSERTPPLAVVVMVRRAARTFPSIISFAKVLAFNAVSLLQARVVSWPWMVWHSSSRVLISPLAHILSQHSKRLE